MKKRPAVYFESEVCGPKRDSRGHRPETRYQKPDTLGGQIPEARHPEATGQKPEPTLY